MRPCHRSPQPTEEGLDRMSTTPVMPSQLHCAGIPSWLPYQRVGLSGTQLLSAPKEGWNKLKPDTIPSWTLNGTLGAYVARKASGFPLCRLVARAGPGRHHGVFSWTPGETGPTHRIVDPSTQGFLLQVPRPAAPCAAGNRMDSALVIQPARASVPVVKTF